MHICTTMMLICSLCYNFSRDCASDSISVNTFCVTSKAPEKRSRENLLHLQHIFGIAFVIAVVVAGVYSTKNVFTKDCHLNAKAFKAILSSADDEIGFSVENCCRREEAVNWMLFSQYSSLSSSFMNEVQYIEEKSQDSSQELFIQSKNSHRWMIGKKE